MIKKKFNEYIKRNSKAVNVLLGMVNIFILPPVLLLSRNIYFNFAACLIFAFLNYKIIKEAYLKNDKILKGKADSISSIMSLALPLNYLFLVSGVVLHWSAYIILGIMVLQEINIIGEYYDVEEIKRLN